MIPLVVHASAACAVPLIDDEAGGHHRQVVGGMAIGAA